MDKSRYPVVTGRTLFAHLMATGKEVGNAAADDSGTSSFVNRPLSRGNALYFYGYVHDVSVCFDDKKCFVTARCWATQRKSERYTQKLMLTGDKLREQSCTLEFATCIGCVAGFAGGLCSHVFAVLLVLEEERKKSLDADNVISPTSLPRTWGPRQRDVQPEPVMDVVVEKPISATHRKKDPVASKLYEARGKLVRKLSADDLASLRDSLPDNCPMKCLMPSNVPSRPTDYGDAPFGSPMTYHCQRNRRVSDSAPRSKDAAVSMLPLPFPARQSQPPSGFLWPIQLTDAQRIESETVGQAGNSKWIEYHRSTLTASNFWRIGHRQSNHEKLVESLFDGPSLENIPAIQHGRAHEASALRAYVAHQQAADKPVQVRACGIALYEHGQFIGASPDAMVFDPSAAPRFGLAEVKCPYSAFRMGMSATEAAELEKGFCLEDRDGQLSLKRNHPYFWQVQGQMAVTNAKWCDFVVWLGHTTPVLVERIVADKPLWRETILPCLQEFYATHALPYLQRLGRRHSPALPKVPSTPLKSVAPGKAPPPGHTGSFSRYEMLLPHDQCQSRIDGRSGSNACTVICFRFCCAFLQGDISLTPERLCDVMRAGNNAYDSLHTISLLAADEVLEKFGSGFELVHESFVAPSLERFNGLCEDLRRLGQASTSFSSAGLFVITPYTFALCFKDGTFFLFDSHSHGRHGALLAEMPIDEAPAYMVYFFATHYPHLRYDASAARNVFAHMTFIGAV